ncbi:MAG: helix-turn-helix domain-containing protein, partial [Gammaproteobacteria bacterium]
MPDKPAQDESPQPKPIGDRLRDAREASGIPLEKIAGDLLLDPSVLEHLEAEEFTALGAPVFVRGHLRKYAMRLGLPGDELVEIYHRDHDRPQGLPIINESLAFKNKNRRGWILLLALLVIAAASVAFVVLKDERDQQPPPPANPAEKKEEAVLETTRSWPKVLWQARMIPLRAIPCRGPRSPGSRQNRRRNLQPGWMVRHCLRLARPGPPVPWCRRRRWMSVFRSTRTHGSKSTTR